MKASILSPLPPFQAGSPTPGLEGAPRSTSHENRMNSVIDPPEAPANSGKEGPVSKP